MDIINSITSITNHNHTHTHNHNHNHKHYHTLLGLTRAFEGDCDGTIVSIYVCVYWVCILGVYCIVLGVLYSIGCVCVCVFVWEDIYIVCVYIVYVVCVYILDIYII